METQPKPIWQAWILLCGTVMFLGAGPQGHIPGGQLTGTEVSMPVTDWSFVSDVREITLETTKLRGWHSVTVWCVVIDDRLYVATDNSRKKKQWVGNLDRAPEARVGIGDRVYPVRAESVSKPELWKAVMEGFAQKYGNELRKYDFPRPTDLSSGRIYELRTAPHPTSLLKEERKSLPALRGRRLG